MKVAQKTKKDMAVLKDLYLHLDRILPNYIDKTDVLDVDFLRSIDNNKDFVAVVSHKSLNDLKNNELSTKYMNYNVTIKFIKKGSALL